MPSYVAGWPTWCGVCGDGMEHQPADARPDDARRACHRCPRPVAPCHMFCPEHQLDAEAALKAQLPSVYGRLEQTHAAEVDAFLERGRFPQARWWIKDPEDVVRDWANDAFAAHQDGPHPFDLRFLLYDPETAPTNQTWNTPGNPRPYWGLWSREGRDPFVAHLVAHLAPALRAAIETLPTALTERTLLDVYCGRPHTVEGDPKDLLFAVHEMVDGILPHPTGLSEGGQDLLRARYDVQSRDWDWHGWDTLPSIWSLSPDLVPDWLHPWLDIDRAWPA